MLLSWCSVKETHKDQSRLHTQPFTLHIKQQLLKCIVIIRKHVMVDVKLALNSSKTENVAPKTGH